MEKPIGGVMRNQYVVLALVATSTFWGGLAAAQGGPGSPPPGSGGGTDSPVIDSINFSGNSEVTTAQLAQAMALKPGDKISKEKMKSDLDHIVAVYRKAGHNLSVSPDISHPAPGHVAIEIKIDESGTAGDAGAAPGAGGGGAPPGGGPPPK